MGGSFSGKAGSSEGSAFRTGGRATHRHARVAVRLSVGEVADGPGQVVGGHARRAGEAAAAPAVHLRLPAALHRHVGQRGVLRVVAQRQRKGGLVERLVEAGEGLPGVGGAELGHRQVAGRMGGVGGWREGVEEGDQF